MRFSALLAITLLFTLVGRAFATDYELTIDPGSRALAKSQVITIYEPYGLIKKGDRIVSVDVAPLPMPNMTCKVLSGSGENSSVLAATGTVHGLFNGEVRLGQGNPPGTAIKAALLMHTVAPTTAPSQKASVIGTIKTTFSDKPWILFLLAAGGLLLILAAALKVRSNPPGTVPTYGRKAFELNVKDIKDQLERITAAQAELVRKPPVLRAFRSQIDRFDKRLNKLENVAVTTQQSLSVLANTVVGIEAILHNVEGKSKSSEATLHQVTATLRDLHTSFQAEGQSRSEQIQRIDAKHKSSTDDINRSLGELATKSGQNELRLERHVEAFSQFAKESKKSDDQLWEGQKKLHELPAAIQSAQEKLAAHQVLLDGLTEQFVKSSELSQAGFDLLRDQLASTETELKALPQALQEQSQENFATLNVRLAATETELKALPASVSGQLQILKAGLADSASSLSKQIDAQSTRLEILESLAQASAEVSSQLVALHGHVNELRQGSTVSQQALDALGSFLNEAAEKAQQHLAELGEQQKEISLVGPAISDLSSQVTALSAGAAERLEKVDDGLGALKGELQNRSQEWVEALANLTIPSDTLSPISIHLEALHTSVEELAKHADQLAENDKNLLVSLAQVAANTASQSQVEGLVTLTKSALENVPSLATLETRLSGLANKDDNAAAELKSLANLLERLADEVSNRRQLEDLLKSTMAAVSDLPGTLSSIQAKIEGLSSTSEEKPDFTPEILAQLAGLSESIAEFGNYHHQVVESFAPAGADPEQFAQLREELALIASKAGYTEESLNQLVELTSNLGYDNSRHADLVQEQLQALSANILALQVAATQHVTQPQPVLYLEETLKNEPAPAEVQELTIVAEVEPAPESPADTKAPFVDVWASVEEAVLPEPPIPMVQAAEELEVEEDESNELPAAAAWGLYTGNPANSWSVELGSTYKLASEEKATRALTPAETPGVEYLIGASLFANRRVVYVHGDVLRGFWPGSNERSVALWGVLPEDRWRLALFNGFVHCIHKDRVEIVDLSNWSRHAIFEGQYDNQTSTKRHWVGLSRKGRQLVVDFRSETGQRHAEIAGLEFGNNDSYRFTAKDDSVYVLTDEGSLGVYTAAAFNEHECKLPKGAKVSQLGVYKNSLYALVQAGPNGTLLSLDFTGKVQKQVELPGLTLSGNAALMGDRLYFMGAGTGELSVYDLKQMSLFEQIPLAGVHSLQKIVGAYRRKWAALLLMAQLDESGKSRSVILLDPKTSDQITICSANQPNSDVLLAGERVVVSTTSTYQNVIRVFEPLQAVEGEQRSAA